MTKRGIKWIGTKRMLTIIAPGQDHNIMLRKSDPLFAPVMELLVKGEDEAVVTMLSPKKRIVKYTNGEFYVNKKNDLFIHGDNEPVHALVAEKLIQFARTGLPYKALINFWNNLKQNPDPIVEVDEKIHSIKDQLYSFLTKNKHPLTEDGCFIAYKHVNLRDGKLVDVATSTFINNVGQVVKMKRSDCDPDPRNTCSNGLHVASYHYARYDYPGHVLVTVLVDPKNVVAVPTDYDRQKMRTCEYTVIGIENEEIQKLYLSNNMIASRTKDALKKNKGFDFSTMSSARIIEFVKQLTGEEITYNPKSKSSVVNAATQIFQQKKILAA